MGRSRTWQRLLLTFIRLRPAIFGFVVGKSCTKPRDLRKDFTSIETPRESSERGRPRGEVSLVMPRVLARMPYGANTKRRGIQL